MDPLGFAHSTDETTIVFRGFDVEDGTRRSERNSWLQHGFLQLQWRWDRTFAKSHPGKLTALCICTCMYVCKTHTRIYIYRYIDVYLYIS